MASQIPEDVAYTITTGYYPQIASKVKYRHKPGKGGTGKKYIRKQGFSDVSIEAERAKVLNKIGLTRGSMLGAEAESGILKGQKLFSERTGTREDPNQTYYKFRGGSDQYKLYGDMVWHMHGKRDKENNIFTNYIKETFGDKDPQFGQIYSRTEPKLIAMAANLAEEIFDISVDAIEQELKAADGTDAAEEIGFSDGEFTYMSHTEAKKLYPDQAHKIENQAMSRANPRDLVVVKDGVIKGTRDVTEMPLTGKGQHGIFNIPPELKEAIKEVKGDGRKTAALRQAVIKMFTSAIDKDYNPIITKLKDFAGFAGQKGKKMGGDWGKVLAGIAGKGGQGSNSVSTITMGNALFHGYAKNMKRHSHDKSLEQTNIEYIAHMLGTMNSATNENFKQSHLVFEHPNGEGVYANVPMITDPDTLLFKASAVEGTSITSGFNATMALSTKAGHLNKASTAEMSKNQKLAYTMSKVTGVTASSSGQAVATANMGVAKGARPATVVTIPAVDELEKALIKDIEGKIPNIGKRLGNHGSKLQSRMYGLGKNRRKMKTGTDPNMTQFWALPYIGVLGSDYIKK